MFKKVESFNQILVNQSNYSDFHLNHFQTGVYEPKNEFVKFSYLFLLVYIG